MPRKKMTKAEKRLKAVTRFLCGERPLSGRWFGGEPPVSSHGYRMTYWWRKHLRAAVDDLLKE